MLKVLGPVANALRCAASSRAPTGGLHILRSSSTVGDAVLREVEEVQACLEEALEGATYIRDSAQQAMLETDPAGREPQDTYTARYQAAARDEIDAALSKYHRLQQSLGERDMEELQRRQDFRLLKTAADSMLTRDKLDAAVRRTAEKLQHNRATCAS